MKKLIIYLLLSLPFLLHAQQPLKGMVTDLNGHQLDAVTLILTRDGKSAGVTFTDFGKFTFSQLPGGTYTLYANLIGYKPTQQQVTLPADSLILKMEADSKTLHEVTVSASKPIIERKADRVTFNVENSIVASGGSAWEALGKAPGVQLTSAATVTANKKNVLLYLDGKPLHLTGDDLSGYLQGMASDLIAKIEVFSNPPANFEAEGAAVINIITKRSSGQGFNVTLNGGLTQATYGSYTGSTSFNYRKDKLNVYGSYGYTFRKMGRDQDDYVIYNNPGDYSYWDSPSYNIMRSASHNYRLGADYQINERQVVGFLVTGNNRSGSTQTNTSTTVTNNFRATPDSTLVTNGLSRSTGEQYAYNLNYNVKLDTNGQRFNIDVDYSPYSSVRSQDVDNLSFLPDGSLSSSPYDISTPTSQQINIYSGKMDYMRKVGKSWNLISGLKYSRITSENNFDFYNTAGPEPVLVPANSNHFDYAENTAAAYISVNGSIGRWSLQGGLRAEDTHIRGYSASLDSLNKRQYFKLFPSLFTTYKIDDDHQLQFSYAYRIERPEYNRLNPAKHYSNPYNYLVGNPSLQPAFIQNLELGYTYRKAYNITAYYTATHDVFSNITVQDDVNKVFYDTHANLGLSVNTGIRLSTAFHVNSWWEMNNLVEGFYQKEKSTYLQGSYDYHKICYDGTTTQSFTLSKKLGLKAEIVGLYNSSGIQVLFKADYNYEVDAGLKATILKGQGTLKLAANDLFYSNTYHINVDYLNQKNGFVQRNDTRNGTISFSYRFGKNVATARTRSTASDDEKKRTQ